MRLFADSFKSLKLYLSSLKTGVMGIYLLECSWILLHDRSFDYSTKIMSESWNECVGMVIWDIIFQSNREF